MTAKRTACLFVILVCTLGSVWSGVLLGRSIPGGTNDLQVVYYGTRCLMQHCDPYQVDQLKAYYAAEERRLPPLSIERPRAVTWYIYLPPTFLIVAPLAILPWPVAEAIWIALLAGAIVMAAVIVVHESDLSAPRMALILACLVLANCEIGFALGNAAVLVVSLCTLGAWCFVRERMVGLGVVALSAALALKPHDVVLVWFYFLLFGGPHRRRALQSLAITLAIGLVAVAWVSQVAPHWLHEWNANVSALTVRGGLSDPGLSAERGRSAGMVIDLQSALSVLEDEPSFYDPISHLVCGGMLLVWAAMTLRSRFTEKGAWLGLAVAAPLTLLVTYHRPYDAKLLLLVIPACALLRREGGWTGRAALAVTTSAIIFTADIPLAMLSEATGRLDVSNTSTFARVWMIPVIRPAPVALLVLAVFYLWAYMRNVREEKSAQPCQ